MEFSTAASSNTRPEAAREAARAARAGLSRDPNLTLVYAWANADLPRILAEVGAVAHGPVIGCTTFGELTNDGAGTESVAVAMMASSAMRVNVGVGRGLRDGDLRAAVRAATADFVGTHIDETLELRGRTLFLFTDGLAGRGEALINELMAQTNMRYQLFGGAAADDAKFERTGVFCNEDVIEDGFVCAEILSTQPFGIALDHGWTPVGARMRVTKAEGMLLVELNGQPALRAYEALARERGLDLHADNTAGFLMDNILGVEQEGGLRLRVPLAPQPDGSIFCAAEVPQGSIVQFLQPAEADILSGGRHAIRRAVEKVGTDDLAGVLSFECAATRLRLGDRFAEQVQSSIGAARPAAFFGGVSFGQLARVEGHFSGLMDASSLVCVIPR